MSEKMKRRSVSGNKMIQSTYLWISIELRFVEAGRISYLDRDREDSLFAQHLSS